ncbi:MAG: GTP-binding protein [Candidatus Thorarchaeota archaeon]|nr:GTP-binding protein [Candidatus Thorarchaeota archaeon]
MTAHKLYKLAVVGNGGVGKSTLIARLITNTYVEKTMTVGFDIDTWSIAPDDSTMIKVACFDFGGQKQFRFFQGPLLTGAKAALVVFDCTVVSSILRIGIWLDLITFLPPEKKVLVGNKIDAANHLDIENIRMSAEEYGLDFILVSSKTGLNFPELRQRILEMVAS